MKPFTTLLTIFLVITFAFTGCKKDDDSPVQPPSTSDPTTYVGTVAGVAESGSLTVVVAAGRVSDAQVVVTGSLRLLGTTDTIALTGTLAGEVLSITGGGYTFTGARANNSISGSYAGPAGSGSFVANPSSSTSAVRVFCGTYQETPPGTELGTFNMVINVNNSINVIAVDAADGGGTPFEGTLTGSAISIYVAGIPTAVIATGTLTGTTVSGTYNSGTTDGTWTGEQF